MKLHFLDEYIPGTKLKKAEMENLTGLAFLKKVFFVSEGVMLTQIRDISGIDSSTLQNWTKRGWVANSKLKKYNMDQVAHILIINMLRSCMQLEHIAFLVHYINGSVEDRSDDIIEDAVLYDYICKILDKLMTYDLCSLGSIREAISEEIKEYKEVMPGARERLTRAIEIIVVAYYASLMKKHSDTLVSDLFGGRV